MFLVFSLWHAMIFNISMFIINQQLNSYLRLLFSQTIFVNWCWRTKDMKSAKVIYWSDWLMLLCPIQANAQMDFIFFFKTYLKNVYLLITNIWTAVISVKGTQASVLVLCSKAEARYGLDMYIQRTWKSRSGQSKDSVSPLKQGLPAVLSCRLDV